MSDSTAVVEQQNPELRHHFVDMGQQRRAASLGMWLFLSTEIMFFGGMFCAYLIYRRLYYTEFAAGSRSLDVTLGAVNTAVLICSSLTVALGVRAAQMGKRRLLVILMLLTLVFGVAFLGIKGVEWASKFKEHHVPGASFHFEQTELDGKSINPEHLQLYFSLYFAMTGMHALHMIIGLGLFIYLTYHSWKGKYTPEYYTPIENGGLYWHFVDIVWIYLFPLLYLIDLKK